MIWFVGGGVGRGATSTSIYGSRRFDGVVVEKKRRDFVNDFFSFGSISGFGGNGAFDVCVYMDAGGDMSPNSTFCPRSCINGSDLQMHFLTHQIKPPHNPNLLLLLR